MSRINNQYRLEKLNSFIESIISYINDNLNKFTDFKSQKTFYINCNFFIKNYYNSKGFENKFEIHYKDKLLPSFIIDVNKKEITKINNIKDAYEFLKFVRVEYIKDVFKPC